MRILGVSAGFHDAGLTVLQNDKILFAGHSERYSKKKHDKNLCPEITSICCNNPQNQNVQIGEIEIFVRMTLRNGHLVVNY